MRRRIMFVHLGSELYGSDRILVDLLEFWAEVAEVILMLPSKGLLTEYIKNRNIPVKIVENKNMPIISRNIFKIKNIFKYIYSFIKTNELIKSYKFDYLYINTLSCSSFLLYKYPINTIKIVHIHEIIERRFFSILFGILIKISCDYQIFVSNASKKIFRKFCNNGIVVYNGIRDIRINQTPKENTHNNSKLICLLLGRIMPEKGYWVLADAIEKIDFDVRKKITIIAIGSPPPTRMHLKTEFIKYIRQKNIQDTIQLYEFVVNIKEYINNADICLIPSVMRDPFPTTVLEAMCAGKALITTRGGGAEEIIKNYYNGILIDRGDSIQLSNAICLLVNNSNIREELGRHARHTYETYLDFNSFSKRYKEKIIKKIIK